VVLLTLIVLSNNCTLLQLSAEQACRTPLDADAKAVWVTNSDTQAGELELLYMIICMPERDAWKIW